jgi:hypothetical protein
MQLPRVDATAAGEPASPTPRALSHPPFPSRSRHSTTATRGSPRDATRRTTLRCAEEC